MIHENGNAPMLEFQRRFDRPEVLSETFQVVDNQIPIRCRDDAYWPADCTCVCSLWQLHCGTLAGLSGVPKAHGLVPRCGQHASVHLTVDVMDASDRRRVLQTERKALQSDKMNFAWVKIPVH